MLSKLERANWVFWQAWVWVYTRVGWVLHCAVATNDLAHGRALSSMANMAFAVLWLAWPASEWHRLEDL